MAFPSAAREVPHTSGKGLTITLWVLQIFAALAFLATDVVKLTGPPAMVKEFDQIGLGQWLRYFASIWEIVAVILLLIPRFAFYGALLLVLDMLAAIALHIARVPPLSTATPAFVLLLVTGTIAYLRRPQGQN